MATSEERVDQSPTPLPLTSLAITTSPHKPYLPDELHTMICSHLAPDPTAADRGEERTELKTLVNASKTCKTLDGITCPLKYNVIDLIGDRDICKSIEAIINALILQPEAGRFVRHLTMDKWSDRVCGLAPAFLAKIEHKLWRPRSAWTTLPISKQLEEVHFDDLVAFLLGFCPDLESWKYTTGSDGMSGTIAYVIETTNMLWQDPLCNPYRRLKALPLQQLPELDFTCPQKRPGGMSMPDTSVLKPILSLPRLKRVKLTDFRRDQRRLTWYHPDPEQTLV